MDCKQELLDAQTEYKELQDEAQELYKRMKADQDRLNEMNVRGFELEGLIKFFDKQLEESKVIEVEAKFEDEDGGQAASDSV